MVSCAGELFRRGARDETIRGLNASDFNERKIGRVGATAPLPYLAPLAGRGRIGAIARIRVRRTNRTRCISAFAKAAPHPNPLPAQGGAREELIACFGKSVLSPRGRKPMACAR